MNGIKQISQEQIMQFSLAQAEGLKDNLPHFGSISVQVLAAALATTLDRAIRRDVFELGLKVNIKDLEL